MPTEQRTTTAAAHGGQYLADYRDLVGRLSPNGATWLTSLRERAWNQFASLGFPTARRGNEPWKYTNVRPIDRVAFQSGFHAGPADVATEEVQETAPHDDSWHTLAFVDARRSQTLSSNRNSDLTLANLPDAAVARRSIVEPHLGKYAEVDGDAFAALNTAFMNHGAVVHVPEGVSVQRPVHLLFAASNADADRVTHPRSLVVLGDNSRLTLVETYASLGSERAFTNAVVEIVLGEGAQLDHYRILAENEKTFHIGITRVYQPSDSTFNSLSFAAGPDVGRNDLHVLLDGEGAACTLNGLYMTANRQHLDNHISTTHAKPHGTSNQFYKGILAGRSRAVFSGKVVVQRDAQKSYAQQKDLNLVLSKGAEIDTMPSLEIYADDVQCFHGATAGHVDESALFYMESRGIDRDTATAMLIHGFASEIVEKIQPQSLRQYVERTATRLLPDFCASMA